MKRNECKLDGSQTTWLIYADWLEDQDIDGSAIREHVLNDKSNQWFTETHYWTVGSPVHFGLSVGTPENIICYNALYFNREYEVNADGFFHEYQHSLGQHVPGQFEAGNVVGGEFGNFK